MAVRLLLYRFFHIRAVVSLPRNIFIDTPTLTSLLFAEKKSKKDIAAWDSAWKKHTDLTEKAIRKASQALLQANVTAKSAVQIADDFLQPLKKIIKDNDWVSKGGRSPSVLHFVRDWSEASKEDVVSYYRDILRTAGFKNICEFYKFQNVANDLNYDYSAFEVDEVGYKLSKRREKARPNQMCSFVGERSKDNIYNLHLSDEEYSVSVDTDNPKTVLDFMRRDVIWGSA